MHFFSKTQGRGEGSGMGSKGHKLWPPDFGGGHRVQKKKKWSIVQSGWFFECYDGLPN